MPSSNDPTKLAPPPPARRRELGNPGQTARELAQDAFGREIGQPSDPGAVAGGQQPAQPPRESATETIGRRAGALSDELDFPEFVASLVHGTFDAIVDSSIRQMESFADMVAAVAKPVDQFARENVTPNQARDWLVEQYPRDLALNRQGDVFQVVPVARGGGENGDEPVSPDWLADFGFQGEELTTPLIEEQLLPMVRERVARDRLQTLAAMVLLGMNRVVVKDGTISARLRFRAAAAEHAKVDYAVSDDGNREAEWGQRGSRSYSLPSTKVSTVGINVQSDSELKAELFGDVKINFASETVPLERFVDEARRTLLERNARPPRMGAVHQGSPATAPAPGETAQRQTPEQTPGGNR